jgi:hypothetical protein
MHYGRMYWLIALSVFLIGCAFVPNEDETQAKRNLIMKFQLRGFQAHVEGLTSDKSYIYGVGLEIVDSLYVNESAQHAYKKAWFELAQQISVKLDSVIKLICEEEGTKSESELLALFSLMKKSIGQNIKTKLEEVEKGTWELGEEDAVYVVLRANEYDIAKILLENIETDVNLYQIIQDNKEFDRLREEITKREKLEITNMKP